MEQQPVPTFPLSTTALDSIEISKLNQELRYVVRWIENGAYTNEDYRIMRVIRWTYQWRYKLEASALSAFINSALLPTETHSLLSSFVLKEDEYKLKDTETSEHEDSEISEHEDSEISELELEDTATSRAPAEHSLPELEIYCYLLVLIFLINHSREEEAKICSSAGIARLRSFNKRTVDIIASKFYSYYSLSYEIAGELSDIRGNLLALHQSATLHHDELGQETLLNLLLRNYLHYYLYDLADKLRSKAPRFESHSNSQFCRYLFYLGKIRTIKLDYSDAKESLLQAARKAPVYAFGFRSACYKWIVIVRLLLGEIPERTVFMQNQMVKSLRPYFELTKAVRSGDLELFKSVAEKFSREFGWDHTSHLIVRVRRSVIRTGLRNISISYSRISLVDVAKKLRLDSADLVADVENIISKAIKDGAIDATLDHANGWMLSKKTGDIYSTNEPQIAFHSRITFCLKMHNQAVRGLRFPPNWRKSTYRRPEETESEKNERMEELLRLIEDEDDELF